MAEAPNGDRRPSPEALLALAKKEGRGRLKVFLGAAPGVGKTYAMLAEAARLKAEGVDVVVGLVETHGRAETQALLAGLEVLPRRPFSYRTRSLLEFDIDAALARRPALLIVDELAHTNAPGSRHPKRYQDVEELLAAGISVSTTVNIQHLDSLSDVVSRVAGIRVRETIPDSIIERADEIVVVDITPDELIKRLKEGKVYLPDNARRAVDNFFKPGTLTALRELALRRTADRVEDQMVELLRQQAVEGPWPAAERVLVCVGDDTDSEAVVRAASRLAKSLDATLIALHVERAGAEIVDPETLRRMDETMRLAEQLGAETVRLASRDMAEAVLRYAHGENISQIVIGRSRGGWLARLRGLALSDEIVRRAEGIAVQVLTSDSSKSKVRRNLLPPLSLAAEGAGTAVASVTAAVFVSAAIEAWQPLPNLSMIFLAAVLFSAVTNGLGAAVLAAVLSFFAYNFFFIDPRYTFTIANPHELLALFFFLLVAVLTGGLASRVRDQRNALQKRAGEIQALYDFSRKLSGTAKLDDVLWASVGQIARTIEGDVIVLMRDGTELTIQSAFPPQDTLGAAEWAAARWSLAHEVLAGWRTSTLPHARFQFRPLRTSAGIIGVLGISPEETGRPLSSEASRQLDALIDQMSVAIERTLLVDETAQTRSQVERERLRSILLSSISHDLRTPLASILGAVTSLNELGAKMSDAVRDDLLTAIEEEARRMSRFVGNLLDMTRLDSGELDLKKDWVDVGDAIRAAVDRGRKNFPHREVDLSVAADLPLIRGDATLLEQTVFNLLDNADKYAEPGTPTLVEAATRDEGSVVITVCDRGPGIRPDELEKVFEKFHRAPASDGRAPGTGLGLAICRRVVEAFGGTIRAESPILNDHGTRIVIRLPAGDLPKEARPEAA